MPWHDGPVHGLIICGLVYMYLFMPKPPAGRAGRYRKIKAGGCRC
jgi:hypothetical protein